MHADPTHPPIAPARRKRIKSLAFVALAAAMLTLTGCNSATTGALLGAAIGSAAGAGIDHNDRGRGAAIGALIGAGTGYIIGNEGDKARASSYAYGPQPGYYEPAPTYYEPARTYYYPQPARVHIDYYSYSHRDYCPPPRHHHHHHHHHRHRH